MFSVSLRRFSDQTKPRYYQAEDISFGVWDSTYIKLVKVNSRITTTDQPILSYYKLETALPNFWFLENNSQKEVQGARLLEKLHVLSILRVRKSSKF